MTTRESLVNLAQCSADLTSPHSGDVQYLVDQLIGIVMDLDAKITSMEEAEELKADREQAAHERALEDSMGSHGQG
jgi:hypothetical protein